MEEAIETIRVFLLPVVESIKEEKKFRKVWKSENQTWTLPALLRK